MICSTGKEFIKKEYNYIENTIVFLIVPLRRRCQ